MVLLTLLVLVFSLLVPALASARRRAEEKEGTVNTLRLLGLGCHNYHETFNVFPSGVDANHFSATAHLLPYLEQENLHKRIDFTRDIEDKVNADARGTTIKMLLSKSDPVETVDKKRGPTNYLFSAGSKPSLTANDGVFYQDSKTRLADITDGTSNTIMIGETLKGSAPADKRRRVAKEYDVKRHYVRLKVDALSDIKEEAGVKDFKDGTNLAFDRCASWMDGRFLQGTFTATLLPNDAKPDVSCAGQGGLSALRAIEDKVNTCFCDASIHTITAKVAPAVWKALSTRAGGELFTIPDN
jgi:hypothetical protein